MATSINFVSHRRKEISKTQALDAKIFQAALGVLGVCFLLFLGVVGFRLYYVFQLSNLEEGKDIARNAIVQQESVEKEYTIFAFKLRELSQLFENREDKQQALQFFGNLFASDVIISGIDYNSSENDQLSFSLEAPTVFRMEEVYSTLTSSQVTDTYPSITKERLGRSSDGKYRINLSVSLSDQNQ